MNETWLLLIYTIPAEPSRKRAALMALRIPDHLAAETMHIATKRGASKEAREPLLAADDG